MIRTLSRPLAVLSVALLAACGGGGDQKAEPASQAAPDAPSAGNDAASPSVAAGGDTVTVRVVTTDNGAGGRFEPAAVTAKRGDVLRFVGDGGAAHNISWPAAENPAGATLPAMSAYLTADGQGVDEVVNLPPGTYTFQCDPHLATGMKGTLTVTG